jgi:hypothetical protein
MSFTKPVKYIFVGKPHLTKTTISKKLFPKDEIFETDILKKDEIYDLDIFNMSANLFVVGGRYYKKWYQKVKIIKKLKKELKDFTIILVKFRGDKNNENIKNNRKIFKR